MTPAVGQFATTLTDVAVGGNRLVIDIPVTQLVSFPVEGVIEVFGERIGFTRRRTSTTLSLTAEDGLPFSMTAGTVILVIEATPRPQRPGGVSIRNEQGGTCALQSGTGGTDSLAPLLLGIGFLIVGRRRRRHL